MSRKKIKRVKKAKKLTTLEKSVMSLILQGKDVDGICSALDIDLLEAIRVLQSLQKLVPASFKKNYQK